MKRKFINVLVMLTIGICFNNISRVDATNKIPKEAMEWNNHYYMYYDTALNWHEAKKECEKQGGHLVTISSQEENDFIFNNMLKYYGQHVMIGLSDEKVENEWKWASGETFSYSNWQQGEPNNENYVLMSAANGKWNDGHLDREKWNYICEWDSINDRYFIYNGINYKYTGEPLPANTYEVPGNLVIDKKMEFINESKLCKIVAKNITIRSNVDFSENSFMESKNKLILC